MSNNSNLSFPHDNFHFVCILSELYFFEPIHTICVSFNPDYFEIFSSSSRVQFRESSNPSIITVVLSCDISNCWFLFLFPLYFYFS